MLVPLLLLWVVSMGIEYLLSLSISNASYDRELTGVVDTIEQQFAQTLGQRRPLSQLRFAPSWRTVDGLEFLYQIRAQGGAVLAGSPALPAPPDDPDRELQTVYFRNETINGRNLRIAYRYARVPDRQDTVIVQAGESLERRVALALAITGGQLSVQFLIVPAALLLVWFGLAKGITPLNELTRRVRDRPPADLSPIESHDAPEEVRAFIDSINRLMSRLEQSLKAQQRFVADAAHQLRTPIAGLRTQAELALRQREPADLEHSLRQIAAGAHRASRVISQLLVLARADADVPPPMKRLDLVQLARTAAHEWVPPAIEKHIDLGFETPGAPCVVTGSDILLRELMNNLVDNALRYTPSGGCVTVRVAAANDISLEIEDNGIGIGPADRERVFDRFYRVLGTETEGTGLGLSIVRAIADAHGARLSLRDNPGGKGTVVRVVFPLASGTAAPLRTAA